MRDKIKQRLLEYGGEALVSIAKAENQTKGTFAQRGILDSSMAYQAISEDNKNGFAEYMDHCTNFIRKLAGSSAPQYADELREAANKLKRDIIARMDHQIRMQGALPGNSSRVQLRNELGPALDKIIKRKLEDFEWNIGGEDMSGTTQNTINIFNSKIDNSVIQINQSGKDDIKEIARKLQQIINSEEIKRLSDDDRLEVLDQADDIIEKLKAPETDNGKVYRGLKRLGNFISGVTSQSVASGIAQLAMAYAKAHGIIP